MNIIKILLNKIYFRFKGDIVLTVSFFLSIITIIFIHSSIQEYLKVYINYSVITLLFCFMISIAGLSKYGFLKKIAYDLLRYSKNTRIASLFIILITFTLSMFLTNDVALITLIPICLIIFKEAHIQSQLIKVVTLQTIAANLGSFLTPFGNPQNLYLFSYYNLNFIEFIKITIIPTIIGLFLLIISNLLIVPKNIKPPEKRKNPYSKKKTLFYGFLFILSLMPIFHILHYLLSFTIILFSILIFDRGILRKIDYGLLITFICFFIFIGNIQKITLLHDTIKNLLVSNTNVYLYSIGLSQIISNVPCAILISNWTDNVNACLLGVNIGGLGGLISSLANLISYNYFKNFRKSQKVNFIKYFYYLNIIFLLIIATIVYFICL